MLLYHFELHVVNCIISFAGPYFHRFIYALPMKFSDLAAYKYSNNTIIQSLNIFTEKFFAAFLKVSSNESFHFMVPVGIMIGVKQY